MKKEISIIFSVCVLISGCGGSSNNGDNVPTLPVNIPVLKWTPKVSDTWQWQLHGTVNTSYSVNVYDIDLFNAPKSTIDLLKSQGKHVICYFSAGSSENFRSDFNQFLPQDMGNNLVAWPGERWLDTRSANVRNIMKIRFDLALNKGCDGVEPDNVEGYNNNSGFPLSTTTQIDYNTFLANESHSRGMMIALKNDIGQIPSLVSIYDFAVNEQCYQYNECSAYSAFIAQGKPVFNAEYAVQYQTDANIRKDLCAMSKAANFHTLVLPLQLDDTFRFSCD